ncbi:sulfite exporter TauE/SafE family protein [Actinoplanes bogorensis]|uniref:Sulfite exporter TauE/SafE family protein n=1 Tax=Paractinoplanes bogorensis TaxID=1610840 RepID=A0ABS5YXV0_9ACTN|nr:sulfite exporter TauE/SafE family protein [Actinoplanes bogorensis]MBU2668274.1 sulfite exporter TauE/SafE family protein [Actinoplanes bogorensis]
MKRLLVVAPLAVIGVVALPAAPAAAHPLGNFSVNRYAGLTVHPDRIDALAVADIAELPTLQEPPASCTEAAQALTVSVNGDPVSWTIMRAALTYATGAGGLRTSRLECRLSAPTSVDAPAHIDVSNQFRPDRIGWRELTATGAGVHLSNSPLPAVSLTQELRHYPTDPLASPSDVRAASFTAEPGSSPVGAGAPGVPGVPGVPGSTAALDAVSRPSGLLAGAERRLEDLVGGTRLTPIVGLLAVLLSLLLGAAHAALPGHGKTVMAAYLAGSRGRPRDAVLVGATVTFTHTAGVIALGLLLTAVSGLAGETVLSWLGLTSGLLVAAVGAGALISALRRRRTTAHHHSNAHSHTHADGNAHSHAHGGGNAHSHAHGGGNAHSHAHGGGNAHSHAHGGGNAHSHAHGGGHAHSHDHGPGKWGIAGIGIAGGLVPSPSALIVLLGAAALGRTVFGVLLVLAYGLGMAATLTAAGLLLVRLRHRLEGRWRLAARWRSVSPPATAALIIVVGLGLAGRALAGVA